MGTNGRRETLVLLRYSGELSTKARATRRRFVAQLMRNARDALAAEGCEGEIDRRYDRVLVELADESGVAALSRVFGLQSVSLAERHPDSTVAEIAERGAALFRDAVRGKRFAVRAKVVGNSGDAPVSGRDIEIALGTRLLPESAGVDLGNPETTARIELYQGDVYYLHETVPCHGGLPLGTENHAVALVSGGFDSAVAAWQMLRRGVFLDYVFCNLGGASHRLGTLRVMHQVASRWSYGTRPHLHAIDFSDVTRELQDKTDTRYWQVILKRLMLRAAEMIATKRRANAIITGEAVGQVSSQTLVNLRAITDATTLPVLRPLVGSNKDEIIAQADRIGTGPLSAVVGEYCALVPRRPATSARLDVVREQESRIDLSVLSDAVAKREVLDLRAWDPEDTGLPEIETSEVPAGARVLDLRAADEFASWHHPDAVRLDFRQALEAFPSFGKDQTYVLVCEFGLKSAHLAELMQQQGFRVHHFRGGTRSLRRLFEKRGGGAAP